MKRSFRTVLFFAALALVVASCGKSETAATTTTAAGGTGTSAAQGGGDCTNASNTVKIGVITPSSTNLAALAKAKIPFVRFMCGGFWPSEQRLYLTNREVFFERLDRVVRCAESVF